MLLTSIRLYLYAFISERFKVALFFAIAPVVLSYLGHHCYWFYCTSGGSFPGRATTQFGGAEESLVIYMGWSSHGLRDDITASDSIVTVLSYFATLTLPYPEVIDICEECSRADYCFGRASSCVSDFTGMDLSRSIELAGSTIAVARGFNWIWITRLWLCWVLSSEVSSCGNSSTSCVFLANESLFLAVARGSIVFLRFYD